MTDSIETPAAAPEQATDCTTFKLDDIPERVPYPITVGRRAMLLFRFGGWVYATAARCTHQGVELAGGELEGALMRCPWHSVRFDVRTGARVNQPNCRDLRIFRTEVSDGVVTVYDQALKPLTGTAS